MKYAAIRAAVAVGLTSAILVPAASGHGLLGTPLKKRYSLRTVSCSACHDNGKLGAQIIGDKKAWAPLIKKNLDILFSNTINGYRHMPPRGACNKCTNIELMAAVKYMVEESKSEGDYRLW